LVGSPLWIQERKEGGWREENAALMNVLFLFLRILSEGTSLADPKDEHKRPSKSA
jgi:hypothetical protein